MPTPDSKLPVSGQTLKDASYGLYAGESTADNTRIAQCVVQRIECPSFTDGGTAATAVAECPVVSLPFANGAKVLGVAFTTPVGVTANDTSYATVSLAARDANGANPATVATQTTKITGGSGNATAFKQVPIPVTPANAIVPAGGTLTLAVAKAGSGVALGATTAPCVLTIWLEEL